MFTNYFKIALRSIWRNKTFSAINIIVLAVSMTLGLLIILIIKEKNRFDTFHCQNDRIYVKVMV
jgi:putative ABC transport system permease protein